MRVVAAPYQRVRVDGHWVPHGDAPQVVVAWPQHPGLLAYERGYRRGAGQHIQQRLRTEVGTGYLDSETEGRGQVVVERGPFGAATMVGIQIRCPAS